MAAHLSALACCHSSLPLQALISLQVLEERFEYSYYMHADDDSYVRLDLVLELLVGVVERCCSTLAHTCSGLRWALTCR